MCFWWICILLVKLMCLCRQFTISEITNCGPLICAACYKLEMSVKLQMRTFLCVKLKIVDLFVRVYSSKMFPFYTEFQKVDLFNA